MNELYRRGYLRTIKLAYTPFSGMTKEEAIAFNKEFSRAVVGRERLPPKEHVHVMMELKGLNPNNPLDHVRDFTDNVKVTGKIIKRHIDGKPMKWAEPAATSQPASLDGTLSSLNAAQGGNFNPLIRDIIHVSTGKS